MWTWVPVCDAFARHDDAKAVLHSVHGRGADAARGGATREKNRVHAEGGEGGGERGTEECGSVLLDDDDVTVNGRELRDNFSQRLTFDNRLEHRDILDEDSAVTEVLVVENLRE